MDVSLQNSAYHFDASARPLRVLVAAHSHPTLSKGGAEIAAFEMFDRLDQRDDTDSWFLGCQRSGGGTRLGSVLTQPFGDREYLYAPNGFDWFKFANPDPNFPREFRALLNELRPDIIHFHHFINFGVEVFEHVKSVLPNAKIILTLHEYLAICNHFGQMITTGRRNLCYESSPRRCAACYPDRSAADFFLRKLYIDRFFRHVDAFVSPSQFLLDRFITWGLPAEKMLMIENIIRPGGLAAPIARSDNLLRFGFFGQISGLKGIDVVFEAARLLDEDEITDVAFEIHGDYLGQPAEFQTAFLESLEKASRNIRFVGPYDQSNVDRLMGVVDAILVPSILWENSPVVIQEALRNNKPVICSDIGGMAEMVRDGQDGFQFPAGNPMALVDLIKRLLADRNLLKNLGATISPPPEASEIVEKHLKLYRQLLNDTVTV